METPTPRLRKTAKTDHDIMPNSLTAIETPTSGEQTKSLEGQNPQDQDEGQLRHFTRPQGKDEPVPAQRVTLGESVWGALKTTLGCSYSNYLLPFVLLGFIADRQGWDDTLVFVLNFLSILPLASLLSFATEELAKSVGQLVGGLINATFGNAIEMIVGITAVSRGETNIVQSSMVGSILSGNLLILGCCLCAGGYANEAVSFNVDVSGILSSLMVVSSASLVIPSVLDSTIPSTGDTVHGSVLSLSRAASVVLLLLYGVYLYFQLKSHADLFIDDPEEEEGKVNLGAWSASIVLVLATLGVTVCSDSLVNSVDGFVETWGISRAFIGLIVVPIIGNAGEFNTAVTASLKGSTDLAIGVIVGSTLQIALFVSPFLVMCGWVIGQPMSLRYSTFETVVLFLSVIVTDCLIRGGRSNYYEGFLLLGTYLIIAIGFYIHPN